MTTSATNSPSTREISSLAHNLQVKCRSWLRDKNLTAAKESPWTLYYVVDTDVVAMYLDPEEMHRYGDVFGDDPSVSATLCRLIGDFIFRTEPSPVLPSGMSSYLLVPPHDEELYRILLAKAKKVANISDLNTRQFEKLSRIIQEYKRDKDDLKLVKTLSEHVPELAALYDANRGDKAALDRFAELRDDKFVNIDNYYAHDFAFPVVTESDGRPCPSVREKSERWQKLLKNYQSDRQPAYALIGDADVLATIEYLNAELAQEKKRVLLITGSPYLHNAANDFVPSEENPHNKTFAYLYIRHPQWVLAHPAFFAPKDDQKHTAGAGEKGETTLNLMEWLGIFLPGSVRNERQHGGKPNAVQRFEDDDDNDGSVLRSDEHPATLDEKASEVPQKWAGQVRIVALEKYANALKSPKAQGAEQLATVMKSMLERNRWSFHHLRDKISEEAANSLSRIYFSAVWLGLWGEQDAASNIPSAMPVLRFDGDIAEVEAYRRCVLQLQRHSARLTRVEIRNLAEAKAELAKYDPSLYHTHVIHAFAFGMRNRWDAVLTLCRIAIGIADALPQSDSEFRKGREAAYLAAIACRRTASGVEGLFRARSYVQEATKRDNKKAILDVRFRSEELAIQTRELFFRYYTGGDNRIGGDATRLISELKDLRGESRNPKNQDVQGWVLRQCCSNFFNLLFILQDLGKTEIDRDAVMFLSEFEGLLQQESLRDPIADIVCGVASVILHPVPKGKMDTRVTTLLAEIEQARRIVSYDSKRYELYKRLFELYKRLIDAFV
jgi:hypothetical protein